MYRLNRVVCGAGCLSRIESRQSDTQPDVVIIGGGVIGMCSAYSLVRDGYSVTILEKGKVGDGPSRENCGLISPSHAPPVPRPGLIFKAAKMMLSSDSPLFVNPMMNWDTFRWFLSTTRRCNEKAFREACLGRQQLLDGSRQLWNEYVEREAMEIEFAEAGCIQVHATEKDFKKFKPVQNILDEIGLPADRLFGDDLNRVEPGLVEGLYGGLHYHMDAHFRPEKLMEEWRRVVTSLGVEIIEGADVSDFQRKGSKIKSVTSNFGTHSADHFVLATGAWSTGLAKKLGLRVPVQPGKGYSITLERPDGCVNTPLILSESSMAVTPWESGLRLGGTMEFSGFNKKIRTERIAALRRGAKRFLKAPGEVQIQQDWYGWRPMTPDGMPIIDRSPKNENLILAVGHNMQGMSMSPLTGQLVQELISGQEPTIDLSYYSVSRF